MLLVLAVCLLVSATGSDDISQGKGSYDVSQEKLEVEIEWIAPEGATSKFNFSHWASALTTFKGYTYLVWSDSNRRPRVAKIKGSQSEWQYLDQNEQYQHRNDGHHLYSMGIDKKGYIHIVGDMHHHPGNRENVDHLWEPYQSSSCMYWISDQPEDISHFTFVGTDPDRVPPGEGFSTYFFFNDHNDELYLLSRQWARSRFWTPGFIGVALAKYDVIQKKWIALGGIPEQEDTNGSKLIFWEDNGVKETGYQGLACDVEFDKYNRLHFACGINNDNSFNTSFASSATHIVYARSDDGGKTFKKANGSPIDSLPLRVSNADIVARRHWFSGETGVAITREGFPLVSYRYISAENKTKQSQWRLYNHRWRKVVELPFTCRGNKPFLDGYGVITTFCDRQILRTTSYNDVSNTGNLPMPMYYVDRRYLRETGRIRYVTKIGPDIGVALLKIIDPTP